MKILIIILTCCLLLISIKTQEAVELNRPVNLNVITDQFNELNLLNYIKSKNIKHPHIVYAQAKLETGNFTSTIFRENNNLFGMKYIHDFKSKKKRKTTAIGSKHSHAVYSHWKQSVDDYLLWQQMFKKTPILKEKDYFKLLSEKYAEDKRYVKVLKTIISTDTIVCFITSNN
jgi:hypothetical protein